MSEEEFKHHLLELQRRYRTLRYAKHVALAFTILIFFGPMFFDPIRVFIMPVNKFFGYALGFVSCGVWFNLHIYYKIVTHLRPMHGKVPLFLTLIIVWANVILIGYIFGFFQ